MERILVIADSILFILLATTVLYLFIFALFSVRRRYLDFRPARKNRRIAVLYPAYKEDKVIEASVTSFLGQEYPKDLYDVVVISDKMQDETNRRLAELPIRLLKVDFENSSKARALNFAMDQLKGSGYEIVVILDADNTVNPDFLQWINRVYEGGIKAIQAHRVAKNLNTDTAVLDAVSEEINNSIFRKGHVQLGFSSALIGSGMAFDYKWFEENIKKVSSAGEDKEIEVLLLKQGIYIEYLDEVLVYDEKTQKEGNFYNQRRRWLAAQFGSLGSTLKDLPGALFGGNRDYADKILQWLMLPRIVVLGLTGLLAVAVTLLDWQLGLKWWGLLLLLLFALCLAIPDYLVDKKFNRAMRKIPLLGIMMVLNFFRLRGANKKFIHTDHSH